MSFDSLGLSKPLLRVIEEKGYETPSPIQKKAIPAVLTGRDVVAAAQTGTGKTAGFALPILQQLSNGNRKLRNSPIRALVLTPTRELAAQVHENFTTYGKNLPIRHAVVFGGVNISPQIRTLRQGVDVLVATPGRLLDLYYQKAVKLSEIETLVLDEADRMLDMGFMRDIQIILNLLPEERQNLLFSATYSDSIRKLTQKLLDNPIAIDVAPRNTAAETVIQNVYHVEKARKSAALIKLIKEEKWEQVLVFTRTKHGANRLTKKLIQSKIQAAAIHGDKSQNARTKALSEFKKGISRVLVATDIAARGLDIHQLPQVVNFELPHVPEDYVHRIGRTGRAGMDGQAVSLVCMDEAQQLRDIERLLQKQLPKSVIEGFEPEELALSDRSPAPLKAKKPKKPKKKPEYEVSQGRNPRAKQGRKPQANQDRKPKTGIKKKVIRKA